MNEFLLVSDIYVELSDKILELLIIPTITAGLLAALVLLVNLFARKWLTAGQMGLLWALVLMKLAMPLGWGPESSYSLTNMFVEFIEQSTPAEPPRDAYAPEPLPEQWPARGANSTTPVFANASQMNDIQFLQPEIPEVSFNETLEEYFISFLEWFFRILPPLWFTGAFFILIRMLVTHWRFTRKINRLPASTDQRLLQLWNTCCEQVLFSRSVPVIVCDKISQPSVMGALHPKLLLPTDVTELNDDQLQLIMLHELAHLKRRDLWVNWILFGLRLFHWWNPLYWLAATRFHALREQSRDAMVLRWREQQDENNTQRDYSREFSELLLTLAQRPDPGSRWRISLPVSLLGFLKSPFRKRSLANRLKALRKATVKVHPLQTTAVMTVIAIFAATGLADIKDPPSVREPERPLWFLGGTVDFRHNMPEYGPCVVQVFDVSAPLKKIIDEQQIPESQARQSMLLLVQNQLALLETLHRSDTVPLPESPKAEAKYGEGNQLIVRAPTAFHNELGVLLNAWRKSGMGQIVLEARFMALSTDIAAISRIEWNSVEGYVAPKSHTRFESLPDSKEPVVRASATVEEFFPVRVAALTKEQEFQFMQTAQGDARTNILFAPKITFYNGQKAMISDLITRPFVIGLEKQDNEQLKAIIKTIDEGTSLSLRPVITADGSEIHLNGLVQRSQILEVKQYTTEVAGKEATIQIPRVHRRRISFASNLKDQQSLLVCIPPTLQEKRFQYVMLRAQILDTSSASKPILMKSRQ